MARRDRPGSAWSIARQSSPCSRTRLTRLSTSSPVHRLGTACEMVCCSPALARCSAGRCRKRVSTAADVRLPPIRLLISSHRLPSTRTSPTSSSSSTADQYCNCGEREQDARAATLALAVCTIAVPLRVALPVVEVVEVVEVVVAACSAGGMACGVQAEGSDG
jgi:hypothetical protein